MHALKSILRPNESAELAESAQADLTDDHPAPTTAHAAVAAALTAIKRRSPKDVSGVVTDDDTTGGEANGEATDGKEAIRE